MTEPKLPKIEFGGYLLDQTIIECNKLEFRYLMWSNDFCLSDINFSISGNDKIAIVGKNGSGKTTLLRLLAKNIDPSSGELFFNRRANIGYFSQFFEDQDSLNQTPLNYFKTQCPGLDEHEIRRYLGRFGLTGKLPIQPLIVLSGGQKVLLKLAILSHKNINLLILDEPTNHLDIETIEILINALQEYPGAIIMVTHHQDLINKVTNKLYLMENGNLREYSGSFVDYKNELLGALLHSIHA